MNQTKKILVIGPHPDDEVLGCGGSILKFRENGDELYWMLVTNVDEEHGFERSFIEKKQTEISEVSGRLGFRETFRLNFPTTGLDHVPLKELVASMASVIVKVRPDVIFLPNGSDVHSDHRVSFYAGYSCTKNFKYPFIKKVYVYETPSETEFAPSDMNTFVPNTFVDISEYMQKKEEIFKIYESEVMAEPFPRSLSSVYALAQYRGSRIGVKYAEAFRLIFDIQ